MKDLENGIEFIHDVVPAFDANGESIIYEGPAIPVGSAGDESTPHTIDGETPEYEISLGNAKETWDPKTPDQAPTPDPLSLAKIRLNQLRAVTKVLKRGKRDLMLEQGRKTRKDKSRRKKKLEKVSRKKNRGR
jgi:hypothetical protein